MQAEQFITTRPLVKVFCNMKQMLKDRGYKLRRYWHDQNLIMNHIVKCIEEGKPVLEATSKKGDSPSSCAIAFFSDIPKLNIGQFRQMLEYTKDYLEQLPSPTTDCTVLVFSKEGLTSSTKAAILADHGNIHFESWVQADLMHNITKHVLFPPHVPLSPRSTQCLLNKYGTQPDKLLQMSSQDAAARYYGLKPGQVVRIERKVGLLPPCVVYRHVK